VSYKKFKDALNDFYKVESNKRIHYEVASEIIRDQWIAEGCLPELTKAVLANWDSGNCEDYIIPLEKELIVQNQAELFIALWKGILKHRLRALSSDDSSNQRSYVLDGVVRMRQGLKKFRDRLLISDELKRLNVFEDDVRSKSKPKYPE